MTTELEAPQALAGRSFKPTDPSIQNAMPDAWLRGVGTAAARAACELAMVDYRYFQQVARAKRFLSLDAAVRLVIASDGGLALEPLLRPEDAAALAEYHSWTVHRVQPAARSTRSPDLKNPAGSEPGA